MLSATTSSLTALEVPVNRGSVKTITPSAVVIYDGVFAHIALEKREIWKPIRSSSIFINSNLSL